MQKINLWHVVGGLVLIVTVVSLGKGVGLRTMAADVYAGMLLDQGVQQLQRQNYAEAEETLQQALQCGSPNLSFRTRIVDLLVGALVNQKKWAECAGLIEAGLAHGVSSQASLRLVLASCYDHIGNSSRAEEIYQDTLKRFPQNPTVYNDLAYHYAQRGIRLDLAMELAKFAVEASPISGAFLDTLGWIYYQKGWLRQAEVALLQAKQLTPISQRAEVWYHLGVVFFKQGHSDKAILSLRQALQLQPDLSAATDLLKELEKRPSGSDITA